ncbi:MAG TPA: PP2C family protein-serine/threonine phosphatase [Roseiflexaceae bacterium]
MNHAQRQPHRRLRATLLVHARRGATASLRPRPAPGVAPLALNRDGLRRQAEIEQDMLLARDIQQGLLLEAVPRLPGWEISAISMPARDLGGDLYDFLPIGDGWHGIMIGDVSGKGLPAALRMAVARTVFRHAARRGEPPGPTLADTNRGVLSEIPQGMVTMLYVLLDTRRGLLRIANAGHNYPVLIDRHVSEIELSGLPLGVDGDSDYQEASAVIHPGDTVVLYTDGVVEASGPRGEIYGYGRLECMLRAHAGLKPRALVAALLHELRAWGGSEQADDITIVIVRRRLARLDAELKSIATDVLGAERADRLWSELALPGADAPVAAWDEALPAIVAAAQGQFGRALARELNGQLRLVLEEYR